MFCIYGPQVYRTAVAVLHRELRIQGSPARERAEPTSKKMPSLSAFFNWRRGWDCTRHIRVPRPAGNLLLRTSAVLPMCRTHFDVGSFIPPATNKKGPR